ncbi:hypothetical protein ACJX0J_017795, partial [Zea mays]
MIFVLMFMHLYLIFFFPGTFHSTVLDPYIKNRFGSKFSLGKKIASRLPKKIILMQDMAGHHAEHLELGAKDWWLNYKFVPVLTFRKTILRLVDPFSLLESVQFKIKYIFVPILFFLMLHLMI